MKNLITSLLVAFLIYTIFSHYFDNFAGGWMAMVVVNIATSLIIDRKTEVPK